jgi:DNA ligase-associated metallophosphoesterase
MQAPVLHKIHQQHLWLSAQRSLFWEEEKALIVSDLHFGKTGHFRKSGIAVPQNVYKEDLQRLVSLLHYFKPSRLIVVGDFFHSHANTELDWFKRWRNDFSSLQITLVKGNHDILQEKWYDEAAIDVVHPTLQVASFLFSHDRCENKAGLYAFCGHIHPGVLIHGLGKQSLRFPCFYFAKDHCILPAFSKFTGAVGMDQSKAEAIFAIVENELIKLA